MNFKTELGLELFQAPGEHIKGWCSCGTECDCIVKRFSNGTRHAWATCPKCGKTNAKSQRLSPSLEELKHRLLWIRSMILSIPKGIDQEEALAMIERFTDDLGKEVFK